MLSPREQNRTFLLLIMNLIMSLIEMIGVASIMPFIAVLTNPEIIETNSIKLTQDKAKEFVSAAKENLKVVENSEIGSLLNFLAEFSINRKK